MLGRAVRLIDPALMGKGVTVFCHVRLKSHGESSEAEFRTFVDGRSEIMECYSISGEWDFMLRIIVGDVEDYEHFLMRTLLKQAVVATASSLFALRQIKYTTEIPL